MRSSTCIHVVGVMAAALTPGESRELFGFGARGRLLAVGHRDGEVKLWETESGALKQRFSPGGARPQPVRCLAWSRRPEEVCGAGVRMGGFVP